MRRFLAVSLTCMVVQVAVAQESDVTTMKSTTTSTSSANLLSELWQMDDAVPVEAGQVDLRLTFGWATANFPENRGHEGDDLILTPSIVWGTCENVEVFATVPIWLGDGRNAGPNDSGNADTNLGFMWRFSEQQGYVPAMALKTTVRIPTGYHSSGVDAELRFIMTNDYDGGLRSHVNVWGQTVNGHNGNVDRSTRNHGSSRGSIFSGNKDLRDFQWGATIGMDGPLCSDGAVRWVADYMHQGGLHNGSSDSNYLEFGFEWTASDQGKWGMSAQIGLDDNEDTTDFGAIVSYSHSLSM